MLVDRLAELVEVDRQHAIQLCYAGRTRGTRSPNTNGDDQDGRDKGLVGANCNATSISSTSTASVHSPVTKMVSAAIPNGP